MSLLKVKREEFNISLRNQRREEIFKKKRIQGITILPFSIINNHQMDDYFGAFQQGILSNDPITQKIIRIKELNLLFEKVDCEPNFDTSYDIDVAFQLLNQGYPQIDLICLQVLISFTLPNHFTCKPILKYLPELIQFFKDTPYRELKQSVCVIFNNLCGDCYECRDQVLIYEIPQIILSLIQDPYYNQDDYEDLANILINISRIKPFISNYYQIQLYKINIQIFHQLKNQESKIGILHFINQICQKNRTLIDLNFIKLLCQQQHSEDCQIKVLALIKQASTFDKAKYINTLDILLNFQFNILQQFDFRKQLSELQQKIINKILQTLTNFLIESINLLPYILQSNLKNLFQLESLEENIIISSNIIFYSFYSHFLDCLNNQQIILFNQSYNQIVMLITLISQNQNDQEIIKEILQVLEIILTRDSKQIELFKDNNGEKMLAKLSLHENEEIYYLCENIFELIE